MKQLKSNNSVFGPFTSVEVLADRYRGDNTDLPFSVVGSDCLIEDYVQPIVSEVVPIKVVPESITAKQARLVLLRHSLLETVETAIATQPKDVQIEWEYATSFLRTSPVLLSMATALNLTSDTLDDLFIEASNIL